MKRYFENGVTVVVTEVPKPRAKSGHAGVHKGQRGGWWVRTAETYLGSYKTIEEAIAVREESVRQLQAGTFKAWAEEFRANMMKK